MCRLCIQQAMSVRGVSCILKSDLPPAYLAAGKRSVLHQFLPWPIQSRLAASSCVASRLFTRFPCTYREVPSPSAAADALDKNSEQELSSLLSHRAFKSRRTWLQPLEAALLAVDPTASKEALQQPFQPLPTSALLPRSKVGSLDACSLGASVCLRGSAVLTVVTPSLCCKLGVCCVSSKHHQVLQVTWQVCQVLLHTRSQHSWIESSQCCR